jgi:ABC-type transport system involved in multi-copper enzyme maturation permease subunit
MANPTESLLRYRPWKGDLRPPAFAALAIARSSLTLLFRRKLFWVLYALALLLFFFYFYCLFLIVWLKQQAAERTVTVLGGQVRLSGIFDWLEGLGLTGSAYTFANFIWTEGYIAMIVLALAGAVLVGNDFHHGSLAYYLSKPIGRRHYVLGKVLGVGGFVHLMTTAPAVVLFVQAGLLYDWKTWYLDNLRLLVGAVGYGAVLTVVLGLLLVATAVVVRRTVPLVMVWTAVFVLTRIVGELLADVFESPWWRLLDLWNDLYLIGLWLLGAEFVPARIGGQQPPVWAAGGVAAAVCVGSLLLLRRRIRAVDVVS